MTKTIRVLSILLIAIMLMGITGQVFADSGEAMEMIFKDGKFIWVTEEDAAKFLQQQHIDGIKSVINAADDKVVANPTTQKVTVDGKEIKFRAYNIGGNHFFMLLDLAFIFKNTKAQFEVGWDQSKFAINLETGKPYTGVGVGFEMKEPHIKETGTKSKATIYKNGKEAILLGYTIKGSTYFKLRDLGNEMGFLVDWDNANQTVVLKSEKPSVPTTPEPTPTPTPTPVEPENYDKLDAEIQAQINGVKEITESEKQKIREEMLVLINNARAKEGIQPLILNTILVEMADYKAKDMKKTNTVAHDGSYGAFKDLLSLFNIDYKIAGENILDSGVSVEEMFNRWWNSPGHKANMMSPKYNKIGIGFANSTQHTVSGFLKDVPKEHRDNAIYDPRGDVYIYTMRTYLAAQEFTN